MGFRSPQVFAGLSLTAAVIAAAWADPALAGRALEEPMPFVAAGKAVPKADAEAALVAIDTADKSAFAERCKTGVRATGLEGVLCRAAVLSGATASKPLATKPDVDKRIGLLRHTAVVARSLSSYEPLSPETGFSRNRFDALRFTCRVLMQGWDALRALPQTHPGAKLVVDAQAKLNPKAPGSLKDAACTCSQSALDLSTGANASVEERGALQSLVTSHGCFLDDSKLVGTRDPGKSLAAGSDATRSVTQGASTEGQLRSFAASRDVELGRCRDKHISSSRVDDPTKFQACACGVMQRWKFPVRKGDPVAAVRIPVAEGADMGLEIEPNGVVKTCGDLKGKLGGLKP